MATHTPLTLRPYTGADWNAVRDLHNLCKPDEVLGSVDASAIRPLEEDAPMRVMFCRSTITVAVEGEAIVGFVGTIGSYISWLCVHPDHRRAGVGTTLLRSVLTGMTEAATLNVFTRNDAARRLYERLGFVVDHEFVGNFNGHPVDVVRLRLGH